MKVTADNRGSRISVAVATLIGTSIEWFDFYIFGLAAALVFPTVFFPHVDPFAGLLQSYAVFWVAFLGRPLGGVLFGHFGDKVGRKAMLVVTLTIMGIATFLVGVLPGYNEIGVLAPMLLLVLRLSQGLAVGGEWGGAVLMAAEHAGTRAKGLLGSFPQMGVPIGLILAYTVFNAVIARYSFTGLLSGGWRLPFFFSVFLVAVGLFVRLRIGETPAFERVKERAAIVKLPALTVLCNNWKTVLLAGGAFLVINGAFYLLTTQIVSYGAGPHSVLKLQPGVFTNAIIASAIVALLVTPFAGRLSDRIGRRPVYIAGVAMLLLFAVPIYALVDTKQTALITLALCLGQFAVSTAYGPLAAMFSEMFAANVRYSGASLGYQGVTIVAGGIAPLVATFLLRLSGSSSWILALYLMAMASISLASILLIHETRDVELTESLTLPVPAQTA